MEQLPRLEDCLKRTILRYGIPRRIYVDNGAIYSSRHLQRICGWLCIRLTHSRPYSQGTEPLREVGAVFQSLELRFGSSPIQLRHRIASMAL